MRVRCPNCGTGYLLPDHLLGEHGARVRCPQCQGTFVVTREQGSETEPASPAEGSSVAHPPPDTERDVAPPRADAGDAVAPAPPDARGAQMPAPPAKSPTPKGARDPVPPVESPKELAHDVLEELEERLGERLVEARAHNRVLAEVGPDLLEAFDEYRRRLGKNADPDPFRQALRERWALDLEPGGRF